MIRNSRKRPTAALFLGLAMLATSLALAQSSSTSGSTATKSTFSSSSGSSAAGFGASAGSAGSFGTLGGFGTVAKPMESAFSVKLTLKQPEFFGASKAATGTVPGAGGTRTQASAAVVSRNAALRTMLRSRLEGLLGVPYREGGRDPSAGLDAAGLVWHTFGRISRSVPDDPVDQQCTGQRLGAEQFVERGKFKDLPPRFLPGDILFFRVRGRPASSVPVVPVLYFGDGKVAIASKSRGAVVLQDISRQAAALAFVQRVIGQ